MKELIQILFFTLLLSISASGQQLADMVLLKGKVFTSDPAKPFAEAIALHGDRIVAVGTSAQVEKLAGRATQRIDLQGRTVVPGFNDAHDHFGIDPKGVQLEFKAFNPSWKETIEAVKRAAKEASAGTWIFGTGGFDILFSPEATRFSLDRVAPDHPVVLRDFTYHGWIANSKAMSLLHIADDEPDPPGGYYQRAGTDSNRINGRFFHYAAWSKLRALNDLVTDEEFLKALQDLANEELRYGITSVQIMPGMAIDRFTRLLVQANLPIRIRAMPFSLTTRKGRDLGEIRQLAQLNSPRPRLTVSGIKWVLDGSPIDRDAALRRDYNDRPGWRGRLIFSESDVVAMVKESLDFKQQLLLHCVGDRAAEVALNALDKYAAQVNWPEKRVRIEHADGIMADLIPRARQLGVIVVQNPTHFADPDLTRQRWGTMEVSRFRSLLEAGIPIAIGSDGERSPYLNIMFATTHPTFSREAITREQAVRAYTYGSAFAEFAENEKGTIERGKLADLVVLSQDIFTIPASELPKTVSLLTIVGGKIVYDAQVLK